MTVVGFVGGNSFLVFGRPKSLRFSSAQPSAQKLFIQCKVHAHLKESLAFADKSRIIVETIFFGWSFPTKTMPSEEPRGRANLPGDRR
jgi:hypothetical protein